MGTDQLNAHPACDYTYVHVNMHACSSNFYTEDSSGREICDLPPNSEARARWILNILHYLRLPCIKVGCTLMTQVNLITFSTWLFRQLTAQMYSSSMKLYAEGKMRSCAPAAVKASLQYDSIVPNLAPFQSAELRGMKIASG